MKYCRYRSADPLEAVVTEMRPMAMRLIFKRLLPAALLLLPVSLLASEFRSDPTGSEWLVNSSVFECRMSHGVPYYGQAVFYQRAGESQRMVLDSASPRLKTGKASVISVAPEWLKKGKGKDLGYVSVTQSTQPIQLDARLSQQVLAELYGGKEVIFTRRPWYGADKSLQVGISAVNFRAAYDHYLACLTTLLPVNYEQIERTAIYFGSGKEALLPSEMKKIDHIGLYFKADSEIAKFYVDGHTDSIGDRNANFELARERAEMVTRFLVARGIPSEIIVTRWHGERYPVTTNQTRKGRAQNRRVTIRLEKEGDNEVENVEEILPDSLAQR